MTDKSKALIVVILDRSGSMGSIQRDMIGGFAQFIKEQKNEPGECFVSLYQFDTEYDVVYENKPIASVGALPLEPRGGTALLDATGKTIVRVGEQLAALPEKDRPGAIIIMIITDGQENSSSEWTRERVKALIKQQDRDYNWKFMYLGADLSTFAEANSLGVQAVAHYSANSAGVAQVYSSSSRAVGSYRNQVMRGVSNASLHIDPDQTADDDEKTETKTSTQ